MNERMATALILGGLLLAKSAPGGQGSLAPDDWPHWYGPSRNGTAAPLAALGGERVEVKELWRRDLGLGIASLVAVGDAVYTVEATDGKASLLAFASADGTPRWRAELGPAPDRQELGPATTPASDGVGVFVLSPSCELLAFEAKGGEPRWRLDLKTQFAMSSMPTGCWSSVLLTGSRLIVNVNGEPDKRLVALDVATGEVIWTAPAAPRFVRSSAVLATLGGVEQVVVHSIDAEKGVLTALRASDGAFLWRHAFTDRNSYSYDTPLVGPDGLLGLATWNDFRVLRVLREADNWRTELLWTTKAVRATEQPFNLHAVFSEGALIGFGGEMLTSLEAATGVVRWQAKIYPGSLIAAGDRLLVLSQASGLLRVVDAGGSAYQERLRAQVFPPGVLVNTPPTLARGRVYLRSADELVAFQVVSGSKP